AEDSRLNVYAGELEVRPRSISQRSVMPLGRNTSTTMLRLFCSSELVWEGLQSHLSGCNLGVTMEEVDLRSQHVGEACSPFVDVVMATAAAEQFGTRCPARHLERGRNGRDGVRLWNDEQEGDADGAGASHGSTPGEAEQRPRGHAVMPLSAILR